MSKYFPKYPSVYTSKTQINFSSPDRAMCMMPYSNFYPPDPYTKKKTKKTRNQGYDNIKKQVHHFKQEDYSEVVTLIILGVGV